MEAALYHQPITSEAHGSAPVAQTPLATVRAAILTLAALDRDHGAAWDDCVAHAAEANPFIERWFVMASARNLGDPPAIAAVAAFRGEQLVALMPLARDRRYYRLPIPVLSNWVHANAFLGMPLMRAGDEMAAWHAMLPLLDAEGPPLLHLTAIVEGGAAHAALLQAAARPVATVMRHERALLHSELGPTDYYETTVRKKKRKELKRLMARLAELGPVETLRLTNADDLDEWINAFLALEAAGWKGREGSAIASEAGKRGFFVEALTAAQAAGRLELLRMTVAGRTIAMLVNFLTPPGSASFKIAYDEEYARFSPGVLIQIDNYTVLDRPDIAWMDSCASANHPMIDSLWAQRRAMVRLTLPLGGWRGRAAFRAVGMLERIWAAIKSRRQPAPARRNDDDDADL